MTRVGMVLCTMDTTFYRNANDTMKLQVIDCRTKLNAKRVESNMPPRKENVRSEYWTLLRVFDRTGSFLLHPISIIYIYIYI